MQAEALARAKEYRQLAQEWRDRAGNLIGEQRQAVLEIAGQYERLAAYFERAARVLGDDPAS